MNCKINTNAYIRWVYIVPVHDLQCCYCCKYCVLLLLFLSMTLSIIIIINIGSNYSM